MRLACPPCEPRPHPTSARRRMPGGPLYCGAEPDGAVKRGCGPARARPASRSSVAAAPKRYKSRGLLLAEGCDNLACVTRAEGDRPWLSSLALVTYGDLRSSVAGEMLKGPWNRLSPSVSTIEIWGLRKSADAGPHDNRGNPGADFLPPAGVALTLLYPAAAAPAATELCFSGERHQSQARADPRRRLRPRGFRPRGFCSAWCRPRAGAAAVRA